MCGGERDDVIRVFIHSGLEKIIHGDTGIWYQAEESKKNRLCARIKSEQLLYLQY
jgi:hypothetical protein